MTSALEILLSGSALDDPNVPVAQQSVQWSADRDDRPSLTLLDIILRLCGSIIQGIGALVTPLDGVKVCINR